MVYKFLKPALITAVHANVFVMSSWHTQKDKLSEPIHLIPMQYDAAARVAFVIYAALVSTKLSINVGRTPLDYLRSWIQLGLPDIRIQPDSFKLLGCVFAQFKPYPACPAFKILPVSRKTS